MKILLSNDDGVHAEGLAALKTVLSAIGRVIVVAPDRERSASSHSLTIHAPLRVNRISEDVYTVDGTPADAVHLALNGLLRDDKPDLVVSGINQGGNLGDDVHYSGTVAAAKEACMSGLPAFAISLVAESEFNFDGAAAFAVKLSTYLREHPLPHRTFLNVNIPNLPPERLNRTLITRLGHCVYTDDIIRKDDPRGQAYYWIGGRELGYTSVADSDLEAIAGGCVSVTPLCIDQTDHEQVEKLRKDGAFA